MISEWWFIRQALSQALMSYLGFIMSDFTPPLYRDTHISFVQLCLMSDHYNMYKKTTQDSLNWISEKDLSKYMQELIRNDKNGKMTLIH